MGLIDFVRSAGEKLFGSGDAAAAPTTDDAVLTKRATALEEHVRKLGLPVDGLKVKVVEETAHVKGRVESQAVAEKVVLAVGNVTGIAKVDSRLEVTTPEPEARFHTVAKGDTLSAIAKKHYGEAGQYMKIFTANEPLLKDPDEIYPGQVLRIP